MRLAALLIVYSIIAAACSTATAPRPRADGPLTGQETAERAARAAHDARERDDTGIIVASSHRPTEEAEVVPEPPPAEERERHELAIDVREGVAYDGDVPLAPETHSALFEDAVRQHDELVVILRGTSSDRELLGQIAGAAVTAGAQRVHVESNDPPQRDDTPEAPATQPSVAPPPTGD